MAGRRTKGSEPRVGVGMDDDGTCGYFTVKVYDDPSVGPTVVMYRERTDPDVEWKWGTVMSPGAFMELVAALQDVAERMRQRGWAE